MYLIQWLSVLQCSVTFISRQMCVFSSFSGTAPAVDFESTGFSAGRMVKKDGAVSPEYHVNDYLCSVRVVADAARKNRSQAT